MTGGQLGQFLLYAVYVAIAAASLSEMWGEVQRAAGAMERLVELQNAVPTIVAPAHPVPMPAPGPRRDPLRARLVPLPVATGSEGARRLRPRDPRRRDRGVRRTVGRGQEHDVPVAAALLRSGGGPHPRRRRRRRARRPVAGAPHESASCRRTRCCSRRARARTSATGARARRDAEVEAAATAAAADEFLRKLPRGIRHVPRRARHATLGRPAAAHRDRARHPARPADPAARRGHERARRRERAAGAGGARPPDAQPHDDHHRAPARDRAQGRSHRRDGPRTHRRAGHARRTGAQQRAVCAPRRAAVRGRHGRRDAGGGSSERPESARERAGPADRIRRCPTGGRRPARRAPLLAGRYCRVEPLEPARHGPELHAAYSLDREGRLWTYLFSGPFATEGEFMQWLAPRQASDDPLFFAIVDAATGRAVGLASYLRIDPAHGAIEVGSPRVLAAAAADAGLHRSDVPDDEVRLRPRLPPLRVEVRLAELRLAPGGRDGSASRSRESSGRPSSTRAAIATRRGTRSSTTSGPRVAPPSRRGWTPAISTPQAGRRTD